MSILRVPYGKKTIDGTKKGYENAVEIKIEKNVKAFEAFGNTAKASLMWDEEGLYIFAECKKEDVSVDGAQPWDNDSFEIFINEDNSKSAQTKDGDGQYRVGADGEISLGLKAKEENITAIAKMTDEGYTVDAYIKFETKKEIGHVMGFDILVNDRRDGARRSVSAWVDNSVNGWLTTENYGTIMLAGDISLMQEKLRVFSNKEIIDLATGYVRAYEKHGFPVFERVTQSQVKVLNGYNGLWQRTSGVSLNFHTNSKFVAMELFNDYESGDTSFDFYVDGVMAKSINAVTLDEVTFFKLNLDGEMHNVQIYYSNQSRGFLRNLAIEKDAVFEKHQYKKKILFLGDSITEGAGATTSSMCYANIVAREMDYEVLNQAISGYGHDADYIEMPEVQPDVVLLAMGINDQGNANFEEKVREYHEKLDKLFGDKEIYIITPRWTSVHTDEQVLTAKAKIIKSASRFEYMQIIEGDKTLPHDVKYFADGVHPNNFGYHIEAVRVISTMKK